MRLQYCMSEIMMKIVVPEFHFQFIINYRHKKTL